MLYAETGKMHLVLYVVRDNGGDNTHGDYFHHDAIMVCGMIL